MSDPKQETNSAKEHISKVRQFSEGLKQLINACGMESFSNTPDHILSGFLTSIMGIFHTYVKERDRWYGIEPHPGQKLGSLVKEVFLVWPDDDIKKCMIVISNSDDPAEVIEKYRSQNNEAADVYNISRVRHDAQVSFADGEA